MPHPAKHRRTASSRAASYQKLTATSGVSSGATREPPDAIDAVAGDGRGGARRRDVYRCGERAESFSIRPRPSAGPGGGALHASRRARAARRQESPPFVRLSTAHRVARAAAAIEAQRATE